MRHNPVRLDFADSNDDHRVVVEWLLSSVCNYSCSYCPAYLHDGRVRWPAYEYIVGFCRRAVDHYAGNQVTFLLTGGEVTMYRRLPELAMRLREMGAKVAILTNGSRSLRWWRQYRDLFDHVIISYHHERADDDHLIAVAGLQSASCPVELNVVIDPNTFDRTMDFARRAEADTVAVVNRKIMFENGWLRRAAYSLRQHEQLADALAGERASAPRDSALKGEMLVSSADGSTRLMTALQILDEDLNHWSGWRCSIGAQTLFVRFDEVWRAVCRVGGPVGTIYDPEIVLPSVPVRCTADSCNCIAGIKAAKVNPNAESQDPRFGPADMPGMPGRS